MSQSLDQELSLNAIHMGLADHVPQIHHSDQGVHYAAHAYIDLYHDYQIEISNLHGGDRQTRRKWLCGTLHADH